MTDIKASDVMQKINPASIADLIERMEAVKKELKEHGADALKLEFKKFFEAHPKVEALRWTQYTPYFNDGDTCYFRVSSDFDIKMFDGVPCMINEKEARSYSLVNDDGFVEGYASTYVYPGKEKPQYSSEFLAAVVGYKSLSRIDDEIYRIAFGDHVQVTATRKGFVVEEYDHE